jgi:hypothetical protein
MLLKDASAAYDTYSSKASEISRQLCFAGIAVIWIFRTGDKTGGILFSNSLLWPLGGFVVSLAFDLLQYVAGAILWSRFHRAKELSGVTVDQEFKAPREMNWLTVVFFYSKVALTMVSYAALIRYIAQSML